MNRGWIAGVVAVVLCAWTQVASAGPVILAGHDADDHGFVSEYTGLFDALLANVTNGGSGILAIGAVEGEDAGDWIEDIAAAMSGGPYLVTFLNGADIGTDSFSGFAIIHIPSDDDNTFGGISAAENALLTARADDIAAFVNSGGGLFGLTQGELADAYGYITGAGGLGAISTLFVDPSGELPSGDFYDDVTATPEGITLGITNTNVDGCCWHNVFTSFPSFFDVLAVAEAPDDPDFDQEASVIGGATVTIEPPVGVIPEPSSMLLFGLGGLGAGWMRRRKRAQA